MRAWLMHPDRELDPAQAPPENAEDLVRDLELDTIIRAAAGGDDLVRQTFTAALLDSAPDAATVTYRQQVLADCRAAPAVIRELYALAGDAVQAERRVLRPWSRDEPSAVTASSVQILELAAEFLARLRALSDAHAPAFGSPGLRRFFAMVAEQLDDEYLSRLRAQLQELHFPSGLLISAPLGAAEVSVRYIARQVGHTGALARLRVRRSGYGFTVPERDEAGFEALRDLENRGLAEIAGAVSQAADHVKAFFGALRTELSFYVGALNLDDALGAIRAPRATPVLAPAGEVDFSAEGLYDLALALLVGSVPVVNEVPARHRPLVVITGANQGGKSTLLRAIGQAQLMAGAGLQVGAAGLRTSLCSGVFTHHRREEDAAMEHGKLDEELARMSRIADLIRPGALLLCNESFASTNEREGSEIARQVVRAMVDSGVRVACVTHQYELANGLWDTDHGRAVFLRAERLNSGARTYRLVEGPPLPTSFGVDSYEAVFGPTLPEKSSQKS